MAHVAVFGCGFVGSTVADYLESQGHQITRIDPKFGGGPDPYDAIMDSDGIIICVPTPMGDNGECDDSIVCDVLAMTDYRTRILLKSTVTYDNISEYPMRVVYNPEFLRERHAKSDFAQQKFAIYGHHENNKDDAQWWNELFGFAPMYMDRVTASMVKYVHNSWLATKVAWFHELYANLPEAIDYEQLTTALGYFPNIGPSHMQAPNHEGKLGYSGACFPKDVNALTKVIDHSILEYVDKVNRKLQDET